MCDFKPKDIALYRFETRFYRSTLEFEIVALEASSDTVYERVVMPVKCWVDVAKQPRYYCTALAKFLQGKPIIEKAINTFGAVSGSRAYIYRLAFALHSKCNIRGYIVHHDTDLSYVTNNIAEMLLFKNNFEHQQHHKQRNESLVYELPATLAPINIKFKQVRKQRLSPQKAKRIRTLLQKGKTYRYIQTQLNVSSKTIAKIKSKMQPKELRKAPTKKTFQTNHLQSCDRNIFRSFSRHVQCLPEMTTKLIKSDLIRLITRFFYTVGFT